MKKKFTLPLLALGALAASTPALMAQDTVTVTEESITLAEVPGCTPRYYNTWRDGWFLQAGAGADITAMEDFKAKKVVGVTYNFGFGRWFSPYFAFRFSGYYGRQHETLPNGGHLHWRSANLNLDLMWDLCNSLGGVNLNRPVSVVPFIGVGGTYNWDFAPLAECNIIENDGTLKTNTWAVPVSAGLQLRFRLCKYVDLFLEARAQFAGDSYNNLAFNKPIDINFMGTGGITVNIGGRSFQNYDPCAYTNYITMLNNEVNTLRGDLAATAAALATAEAQLPCPEPQTVVVETPAQAAPSLLSTVRFTINSAKVSSLEMVNVYNVAQYLKENPDVKIVITGYADKDTGTSGYNQKLSERRAQAVYDLLVNNYGISADRLQRQADGSATQPYTTNDWNRIVIFTRQ